MGMGQNCPKTPLISYIRVKGPVNQWCHMLRPNRLSCFAIGSLLAFMFTNFSLVFAQGAATQPEVVRFESDGRTLGGELFKPPGSGPFPALLYNHGSAPGVLNSQASKVLGPLFTRSGWVFFMPYRRGQGLSAEAGPYIVDEIDAARRRGGRREASATMTRLLTAEQLNDQVAAFGWLKAREYVNSNRIAAAGNSFGGIQSILGAAKLPYCAAVAASAASETWRDSPEIQQALKSAVRQSNVPMFLFQAQNDFDLSPNKTLVEEMQSVGKSAELKVYPVFGTSAKEGHSFAYLGSETWFPDVLAFLEKNCKK